VQLTTGVPVAFGVLTTEDEAQAKARSDGPGGHNVGEEAAWVAVEMARLAADHPVQQSTNARKDDEPIRRRS
jgi:6,7-dimethyl-8-ribityllumazine synthase